MAPALPLIFLAVQEGMTAALDRESRLLERSTWILLIATIALSSLASQFPGDLGPVRTYELHRLWMTASGPAPYRTEPVLGRLALEEQIQRTGELRDLGIFLRNEDHSSRSLLTPWPGAISYLSGMRVLDLFGRTTAPEGVTRTPPWSTRCGIDVVAALEQEPDYILPALISAGEIGRARFEVHFARELAALDSDDGPGKMRAIGDALSAYEWMALHVPFREGRALHGGSSRPVYMLRRRELALAPTLEATLEDKLLTVRAAAVETPSLPAVSQVVNLQIAADDDLGRTFYVNPSGALIADGRVCTRTGLMVDGGLEVAFELARVRLEDPPTGASWKTVRCRLLNPGMRVKHPLAVVSEQVVLE